MIRAAAVDLGAVLFSQGKSAALVKLAPVSGNHRRLAGAILASPQGIWLRQGLIRDSEFRLWLHQQLRSNYAWRVMKNQRYDGRLVDEDIYGVIANLRKHYSLIAFSGNVESRIAYTAGNTASTICEPF
jgi:hypothetical protein